MSFHINRFYVVSLQADPPMFLAVATPLDKGAVVVPDPSDAYPHLTQEGAEDALERCRALVADLGLLEPFDERGPEVMAVHRLRITLTPETLESAFASDEEVLRALQVELPAWIADEKDAVAEGASR